PRIEADRALPSSAYPREAIRPREHDLIGLAHARTRDQKRPVDRGEAPAGHRVLPASSARTLIGASRSPNACRTAASMNEANSGCGRVGRDLSSGWNWQPRNQGWVGSSMISTNPPSG